MIKIKYGVLRSEAFNVAIAKLRQCEDFEIKTADKIMRFCLKLKAAAEAQQESFKAIVQKHAEKHADGTLVCREGPDKKPVKGTFKVPEESREAWEKDIAEFNSIEAEIEMSPLALDKLAPAKPSPEELDALQPIYTNLNATV